MILAVFCAGESCSAGFRSIERRTIENQSLHHPSAMVEDKPRPAHKARVLMLITGLDSRPAVEKELSGSIRLQQAPQLVAATPVAARPVARALSSLHPPDRCARQTTATTTTTTTRILRRGACPARIGRWDRLQKCLRIESTVLLAQTHGERRLASGRPVPEIHTPHSQ